MGQDEPTAEVAPALTAGAVAAHLGVAVSTLRSWSRRYGLGPSRHEVGRHRRYDPSDLARLESMRTLVDSGVSPADAARWVLREPGDPIDPAASSTAPEAPAGSSPRVLNGLVKAAYRFDPLVLANGISRQVSTHGVWSAWEEVCLPLINQVSGDRGGADCGDVEHLVSWTITVALHRISDVAHRPGVPVVLLACVPDEWHTLGLDALRAALAERGVVVRMLGAATPRAALAGAIERTGPSVVVLWSQAERTARLKALTELAGVAPSDTVIIAAGPGWLDRRLPSGVVGAQTLREAVLLTTGAIAHDAAPRHHPGDVPAHLVRA